MYGIPRLYKVLGKIKDEFNGEVLREIVGLLSKMHATDVEGDERREKKNKLGVKKSKGVKKCVVKRDIIFDDYKDCLSNNSELKQMNLIRS